LPYLVALLVAEALLLWVYLFSPLCTTAKRSLAAKCMCSAGFILIAVCAAVLNKGGNRPFALLMIIGLCFSFFGDLFLGIGTKGFYFVLGLLSFSVTHLFYIAAVTVAGRRFFERQRFWSPLEFLPVAAAMLILAAAIKWKLSFENKTVMVLVAAYSFILFTMLSKTLFFSARLLMKDTVNSIPAAALLGGGTALFVLSDFILLLSLFGGKDTRLMKNFNLITYFAAQVMLACSIIVL